MRLKEARLRAGLSQTQLAAYLGVTQVSVCNWESGTAQPRPSTRRKITEILGIEISYPDEHPLTINEQREMFDAIRIASQRLGYQRAIELFADKPPDEIRELTEFVLENHERQILLPPGIEIRRTR
jgi:transcriptional regulator with XRE-family HTH domain